MIDSRWLSGFAGVALLAGCIAEVTFDPVGADASVSGAWTIAGQPPSDATCSAHGIHYVRARFYRADEYRDHPDLVFPCAQASFDTRPELVLADGAWRVRLLAVDAEGEVIAMGPTVEVDGTASGGHVALDPVDFTVPKS